MKRSTSAVHVVDDPTGAASLLHPMRLEILRRLDQESDSATGLSRRMDVPRQKLNYHLRLLETEGLVELVEERQKRGRKERILRAVARSYLIDPATLGPLATDPKRIRDHASSAYLVAVAARVVQEVAALRRAADQEEKRLPTLTVQTDVRFASPRTQQAFAHELTEAIAQLVTKYHDEGAPGGRPFRLVAGAYPSPPTPAQEENP